jgi:hypothetical protein
MKFFLILALMSMLIIPFSTKAISNECKQAIDDSFKLVEKDKPELDFNNCNDLESS